MENLPNELLKSIFQHLSGSDLEVCFYVNRRWASIIRRTSSLWVGDPIHKALGQGKSPILYLIQSGLSVIYSVETYEWTLSRINLAKMTCQPSSH